MSNDLHTLPAGYTIKNPQQQSFGPYHQRTTCIENLSPSWDETHYDMDLVGNDWLHLTQNSVYNMDRFLQTTLSGGSGDQYDPTHTRPLGYYDSNRPAVLLRAGAQFATSDTLVLAHSGEHRSQPNVLVRRHDVRTRLPADQSSDPAWQRPTIFRTLTRAGIKWRYYYQDNSVFLAHWADWNDCKFGATFATSRSTTTSWRVRTADRDLPQVVFIERGGVSGLTSTRTTTFKPVQPAHTTDHYGSAQQRCMGGLGVHPDLR